MLLVGHFDHGEADHLVSKLEAFLENLDNLVLAFVFIIDVHHRIMHRRIELLTQALDFRDPQLLQCGAELRHDHLDAFLVGLVFRVLFQGALQIVIDRQELGHGVGLDVAVERILFLLAAFAEVVILRTDPQELVVEVGLLFFESGDLFLFFGGLSAESPFFLLLGILSFFSLRGFRVGSLFDGAFLLCACRWLFGCFLFRSRIFHGILFRRHVFLLFIVHRSLSSLFFNISLLCIPSGGVSPLPKRLERPAARNLSFAATAE